MAKVKVFELAKELGVTSKEVLAFLKSNGIEAKAAQSSIEESDAQMVRTKMKVPADGDGNKASEPEKKSKSASKGEDSSKDKEAIVSNDNAVVSKGETSSGKEETTAHKQDTPADKETVPAGVETSSANIDTVTKAASNGASKADPKSGSKNGEGKPDKDKKAQNSSGKEGQKRQKDGKKSDRSEGRDKENPPKKKKKNIIFVSNQQNSKLPTGSRPQKQNDKKESRQNNRNEQNDGHRPLIRPLTPPSPTPVVDRTKTAPVTSSARKNPKPASEQPVAAPEVVTNEQVVDTKDNKKKDRQNQDRNQNNQGNQKADHSKGKADQGSPKADKGQSQDGRGPKGKGQQGRDGQGKEKDQGGRRQDRDRRQKKDAAYEDGQVKGKNKNRAGAFIKPKDKPKEEAEEQIKVIVIPDTITIKELAEKMKLTPSVIVKKLFLQGQMVTVNEEISFETAEEIAIEYDIICEREVKVDVIEELLKEDEEDEKDLKKRPPVVCVMGHVDHGKTSLLDAVRKTNVTDKEAGGITQHIGAYTVNVNGEKITFLDTPGHEAFTAMRMRGANSTDIAILVVAADDGVMPQTIEAIHHAKAAGIEIIVAVNKIDKPNANVDRVKQELTEHELIAVDWGGDTEFVPVSAKSGEGLEDLLETILLTAEILELKANPSRRGRGIVVEAELDKGRGPVATVLVQKGTLKVGDFISAGAASGKVRAMIDDKGRRIKEAGPSVPVEILGLSDVPGAGEIFIAHDSDKTAKSYAETYMAQNKEKKIEETKAKMSLDDLFSQIQAGNLKELNVIVKADVQGSVEAVKTSLTKLSNDEVVVKCIHGGVGAITESDVNLASASNAIIIGFNVRPDVQAKNTAETEGVDIRLYKVIYQAIEDVEAAMKGMLDPVFEEKIIGHAEVRQIFKASAVGNIAGAYILDGMFQRDCKVRISREGEQLFEGNLASLKRFKDDVKEVKAGFECGLVFEGYDQMQELDIVEAYIMVEVPR